MCRQKGPKESAARLNDDIYLENWINADKVSPTGVQRYCIVLAKSCHC